MPWGYTGYGYREPAPQRLTLEELLAQAQAFEPAPRPAERRSIADLSPEDRKRARQQSLFAGLAAMGASMQSGDWRNAGAGAQQVAGIQEDAVAQANARADQQWQEGQRAAVAKAENAKRSQQTAALYGMYQRAVEGEDPAGPFAQRAEAAARAGDMSKLETMAGPETKSMRAAARSKGYDPDAWDVNKRLQEELAAELERQKRAIMDPLDIARLKAEEQIRQDAATAGRIAQRDKGVLWQPPSYEPPAHAAAVATARTEAEERVRAKYRSQTNGGETGAFGGKVYKQGEKLVIAKPPDATHPQAYVVPLAGQPEEVGSFVYYTDRDGVRYVQDKEHPDLGAFEVPQVRADDEGYKQGFQHFQPKPAAPPAAAPPPPNRAPEANDVRNRAAAALLQGGSPAEGLARLKQAFPQGVYGFTAEQVLASAIQEARKRGWKG